MNLITGGTGLVGAHLLLHLLQNGEAVRALYRNEKSIQKTVSLFNETGNSKWIDKIEWVLGDITDIPSLENAFQGVSQVYHCAALISFTCSDAELLRKTNIEGTANVVNCALHFGIKKLCYVSSIAVLGDPINNAEIDESCEWNPEKYHSDYAISKYGAEMEVLRGQQEGLATLILSPGIILGPGFWKVGSGPIFTAVAKGNPFYTDGSSGFVAVDDVAALLYLAMNSTLQNERFVLVSESVSFKTLLDWIAEKMQKKKPRIKIGWLVTQIVWRISAVLAFLRLRPLGITKDLARSLHQKSRYSNQKSRAAFGYEFTPIKDYCQHLVRLLPSQS